MGIPLLTKRALGFKTKHPAPFFKDGDFYIDGFNFITEISKFYATKKYDQQDRESDFAYMEKITKVTVGRLKALKPRSITFFLDAYIDEEKFKVRVERSRTKIRKMEYLKGCGLILNMLIDQDSALKLAYTGGEAEDVIMQCIDKRVSEANRQFVFSNDSDMYRYDVNCPRDVEIVPIEFNVNGFRFTKSINLSVLLENVIKENEVIRPPFSVPCDTIYSDKAKKREILELLNCAKVSKRFYKLLVSINIPQKQHNSTLIQNVCFADCGKRIRQLAYRMLIDEYVKNDISYEGVNCSEIEEWTQVGFSIVPMKVQPLNNEDFSLELSKIENKSFSEIFGIYLWDFIENLSKTAEYSELLSSYKVTLPQIMQCIDSLYHENYSKLPKKAYLDEKQLIYFGFTESLYSSLHFLSIFKPMCENISRIGFELDMERFSLFVHK